MPTPVYDDVPLGGFEGKARPNDYFGQVLPRLLVGTTEQRAAVAARIRDYVENVLPGLVDPDRSRLKAMLDDGEDHDR